MPNLKKWAKEQPEKIALYMAHDGSSITFAELDSRADAVARWLIALGLQPGDAVGLLLENHLRTFELWCGIRRAGLYYVPISTHLTANEVAYIVNDCGAKVVIATYAQKDIATEATSGLPASHRFMLDGIITGFESYESTVSDFRQGGALPERPLGREFMYSSGTTGFPKGIRRPMLSYADRFHLPALEQQLRKIFSFDEHTIYLSPSPLYHATGRFNIRTIECGGTAVIMKKFDAEAALAAIDRFHVTHSHWVPTMFIRMLALPDEVKSKYNVSTMRCAIHAAAPCPINVKERMIEWWGPVIEEYYGGSENLGVTYISAKEWLAHKGSVGKPISGEMVILDDDGNPLPPGETGMIYFGGGLTFQYHNDPKKTSSTFNDKGLGTYGDLGHVDADGYLYMSDRRADLIISGGVNIYPQEIENVLAEHPAVADVAVIGVQNPDFGEEVKAIVQIKEHDLGGKALENQLIAFCQSKLSKIKCPKTIDFESSLPRSETGKLLRRILKEKYRIAA